MAKENKKVLLQIIDSLYRGGAQKVVVDITRLFPEFQHIVCYWAEQDDFLKDLQDRGVKVYRIPFKGMFSLFSTIQYVKHIIKEEQVDLIHAHMFSPNLIARALGGREIKVVSTYHGEVFPRNDVQTLIMRSIEKLTFRRSQVNIAVSDHVRQDLKSKLWLADSPIEVVHNYADDNAYSSYELVNYQDFPLRLVATSNNHPYKNYPLLVKAMGAFKDSDFVLDIYGGGMDSLKALVAEQGITNIFFKGTVSNLPELLPSYHIYTAPSHSGEGFSLSLLEALRAGMVVLCSDIPQFTEAIGEAGFTFKNNSLEDLVERLQWILVNRAELALMARRAKQRGATFSKEAFVKNMFEIYNQ